MIIKRFNITQSLANEGSGMPLDKAGHKSNLFSYHF